MSTELQAEVERLRAEVERLRAALSPFAEFAVRMDRFSPPYADDEIIRGEWSPRGYIEEPTLGDCRRAVEALAQTEPKT